MVPPQPFREQDALKGSSALSRSIHPKHRCVAHNALSERQDALDVGLLQARLASLNFDDR
jgi:hypothetical protein